MARVELAAGVGDDLDRIYDHLVGHSAENIEPRIRAIIQAIAVLEQNPLIGSPAESDMRELIIGRRASGYVVPVGKFGGRLLAP